MSRIFAISPFRYFAISLFLLLPCLGVGQKSKLAIYDKMISFNYTDVDMSNTDIRAVSTLWKSYLSQRLYGFYHKIDTAAYKYWNDEEKHLYRDPDLVIATDPYNFNNSQTNIMSIKAVEQGFYQIMNMKGYVDDSTGRFTKTAIYSVLARKVNDKFKLFNHFYREKEKLTMTRVGNVCYYYPQDHYFNRQEALRFFSFEDSLSKLFHCPVPRSLLYLLDKDPDTLMKRLGFYYCGFPGIGKYGGSFIQSDTIILSSTNENHRHEMVLYFTKRLNPDVIGFFDEGLATYLGGTLGNDFRWHLNYLGEYIRNKPDIDFMNEKKFGYIDDQTNPQYVLGAIIMKYAIDHFGFQKALALLHYSQKKAGPIEVIAKELGISKADLNTFFRTYITENSEH